MRGATESCCDLSRVDLSGIAYPAQNMCEDGSDLKKNMEMKSTQEDLYSTSYKWVTESKLLFMKKIKFIGP